MADEIKTPALLYIQEANLPQGTGEWLADGTVAQAITDALAQYSRLKGYREIGETFVGDGTRLYDLSDKLSSWSEGVSEILEVEVPYTAATLGNNELHKDYWTKIPHPANGDTLKLTNDTPTASDTVLVWFTILHTEATVPSDHIGGVAKLAAANMALSLAARTASHKDATVGGGWNASGPASNYSSLATKLRKEGTADLGVGGSSEGGPAAACTIRPIDREKMTSHGLGRLTRKRRIY